MFSLPLRESGDVDDTAALIGVAIACAGNVLISLALTVQKLVHSRGDGSRPASPRRRELDNGTQQRDRRKPDDSHGNGSMDDLDDLEAAEVDLADDHLPLPASMTASMTSASGLEHEGGYLRSRLWWFGLALMGLGETGNFLSYGFAPASVVAPLGTVALIANCVLAPAILGESFTRRNVLGMALAIVGAVAVVWSAKDSNTRLSPDELVAAILAPPFLIYTALNIAVAVFLVGLSSREEWGGRYVAIDVGTCALFGGYTVMATKALSSLISTMFLSAFRHPVAWGAVVVLVATSVLQIKFLNRALMRFESKVVIPTQFVFFSLSAIIGSAVLYQEFRGVELSHFINFAFGIATTFLGVYCLTTPGTTEPTRPPRPPIPILAPVDEASPLLMPERRESMPLPRGPVVERLVRRASASNLGLLNSQGGLLLLATTPPTPGMSAISSRARSSSRASHSHTPVESDARRNRASSVSAWNSVSSRR